VTSINWLRILLEYGLLWTRKS